MQRGLAQKIQEASGHFRVKQRVYMQSAWVGVVGVWILHPRAQLASLSEQLTAELQGHSIKNKDLLAASGAITLRGTDSYDALEEDEEAVSVAMGCRAVASTRLWLEQLSSRTNSLTPVAHTATVPSTVWRGARH